ncbi:MAG: PspC domain-containing protein [Bacteroidetes bacterium]|nr:PspC domain-containing protein [Bacteroidota bacterium]
MHRNTHDKVLGGVLSGLGDAIGLSATLLRVLFLLAFFGIGGITLGISSGAMTLLYVVFWIFTPSR